MDMEYYKEMLVAIKREFGRYRALCALAFAIVLIGVVTAGIFWPKAYESNALVYIDSVNVIEPLLRERGEVRDVDRAEQAEKLIYTRGVLTSAARDIGLLTEESSPEQVEEVITHLRQSITVEAEGENFFRVTYWDKNPKQSFQVLQSVLQTFIGNRAEAKQDESGNAYSFINSQVQLYKAQLDEAERRLKENRANSPDISEAAVEARIASLTMEIQDVEIAIEESESKIATTTRLLQDENQYLNTHSQLALLHQRRRDLMMQLNELRLSYQESYPDIVSIKAQLAEVDAALESGGAVKYEGSIGQTGEALFEDLRKQLSVAEVNIKAQKSRLESLKSLLQEEYKRADLVAENKARLAELNRDYSVIVDVYEELLSRQESAKLSVAMNMNSGGENYKIVEQPVYPLEPGGPRFYHFALAAPVLGLGAPFGLLLAFIMADPRIRSVTNLIEKIPPDLELMAVIPHFNSPAETRTARAEIAMLTMFCTVVIIGYGFLVYAGVTGLA